MNSPAALVILLAVLGFCPGAAADETTYFPTPTLDERGQFVLSPTHRVLALSTAKDVPLRVMIVTSAMDECAVRAEEVSEFLSRFFGSVSRGRWILEVFFGDFTPRIAASNLKLLIGSYSSIRKSFLGFYLPDVPAIGESTIGMDCVKDARRYWEPTLAHELTHLLLNEKRDLYPSWFEEGLAQFIEAETGGKGPENNLSALRGQLDKAFLFDRHKPMLSPQSNALSYLFMRFLIQKTGGLKSFQMALQKEFDLGANEAQVSETVVARYLGSETQGLLAEFGQWRIAQGF